MLHYYNVCVEFMRIYWVWLEEKTQDQSLVHQDS